MLRESHATSHKKELDRQGDMKMGTGQHIERREIDLILSSEMAASYCHLRGQAKDPKGKAHSFEIRESIVLSKEKGEWKIVGLHVDRLPFQG